jgi:hypothetical protein
MRFNSVNTVRYCDLSITKKLSGKTFSHEVNLILDSTKFVGRFLLEIIFVLTMVRKNCTGSVTLVKHKVVITATFD